MIELSKGGYFFLNFKRFEKTGERIIWVLFTFGVGYRKNILKTRSISFFKKTLKQEYFIKKNSSFERSK